MFFTDVFAGRLVCYRGAIVPVVEISNDDIDFRCRLLVSYGAMVRCMISVRVERSIESVIIIVEIPTPERAIYRRPRRQ